MRASYTGDWNYLYNYAKKNPISTSLSLVEGVGTAGKVLSFAGRTKIGQKLLLAGLKEGKPSFRRTLASIPNIETLSYKPPGLETTLNVASVRRNIFNQALVPIKRKLLEYSPTDNPGKIRAVLARAAESYRTGRYGVQARAATRETGLEIGRAHV